MLITRSPHHTFYVNAFTIAGRIQQPIPQRSATLGDLRNEVEQMLECRGYVYMERMDLVVVTRYIKKSSV